MARYRVLVTLSWDMETEGEEEVKEYVRRRFERLPADWPECNVAVRTDKLRARPQKVRLGEFRPDDVIPYIGRDDAKRDYRVGDDVYSVKMNSQRYFIFRESLHCAACGIPGTKMILERHPADKFPHFNLYAEEDGKLVLMTKDHIQAKAFGGEDRHSNYQTMCIICNNLKGSAHITLEGIQELRRIYNDNKDRVPRRQLHLLIQDAKKRLAERRPAGEKPLTGRRRQVYMAGKKSQEMVVLAGSDLNVWHTQDGFLARSVYESVVGALHVACIKKGAELLPTGSFGKYISVRMDDEHCFRVSQGLVEYKENCRDEAEEPDCDPGRGTADNHLTANDPVRP